MARARQRIKSGPACSVGPVSKSHHAQGDPLLVHGVCEELLAEFSGDRLAADEGGVKADPLLVAEANHLDLIGIGPEAEFW